MRHEEKIFAEIKRLYPKDEVLHRLAEKNIGSFELGRQLEFGSKGGINLNTIIKTTSLKDLKSLARHLQDKKELYQIWYEHTHSSPQF